jgi:hypothetical protein
LKQIGRRLAACGALLLVGASGGGTAGAQGVATQHPRLLVTPAMITELKSRMSDPDVQKMISNADSLVSSGIDYGYEGTGYSDNVPTLGLAYLVTGNKKYAMPPLKMIDDLNAKAATGDVSDISVDDTFASRSTGLSLGLAYDWIYPELSGAQKTASVKTVNAYYDWFLTGDRVLDNTGPAYSNYFVGHLLGYGAMGYATDGDNTRAAEIESKMLGLYNANMPEAFATGADNGGFPVEGFTYGTNTFMRMFWYMRMVETATGQKIGAGPDWADDMVKSFIIATKPNLWQQSDEGEYTGDLTAVIEPNQLYTFTSIAGDATTRGYGSWLIQNFKQPPGLTSTISVDPVTKLLFPMTDAPVDYRNALPVYRQVPGANMVFTRSSWDDNAVWASFNANFAILTGHVLRQASHFTLQRGTDYLLVNAAEWKQEKGGPTYTGPGWQGNTFVYPTSAWTNTLYADDGAGGYLLDGDTYDGGQDGFADNQPYLVSQRSDATYVKLDVTHAYQNNFYPDMYDQRAVVQFVRNFAFFAPGNVVVFDRVRVKSTSINYNLRFYFNSNSPPTIAGGVATSAVGASKIFMRPVLPANVAMTTAWQQLEGMNFAPRVELRPPSASTTFDAMTVFTVAGSDFPNPPASNVINSDDMMMVGVQIMEPQMERVAMFAQAPTDKIAGGVGYAVTSTGARHTLYDMQPGASYGVAATTSGDSVHIMVTAGGSTVSADDAGVLAFDVAGTTVTPLPQDPSPLVKEPTRPPPPVMPGEMTGSGGSGGGRGSGGCSCQIGGAGPLAPLGIGVGFMTGLALLRGRRRPRKRR